MIMEDQEYGAIFEHHVKQSVNTFLEILLVQHLAFPKVVVLQKEINKIYVCIQRTDRLHRDCLGHRQSWYTFYAPR